MNISQSMIINFSGSLKNGCQYGENKMRQSEINVIKNICSLQNLLVRKSFVRKTQNLKMLNIALLQKLAETTDTLHVAIETRKGDDEILYVFVGVKGLGIVAQYHAGKDEWIECFSHGNSGTNFATGGTWSSGAKTEKLPEILENFVSNYSKDLGK